MPQNTLYVTGFSRETKAADLAPDFEKYGDLVRLDIPPPRSEEGQKFAFVEFKNAEDSEKALELDGKTFSYTIGEGLTVQVARSDPFSNRRGFRGGFGGRGGYGGRGGAVTATKVTVMNGADMEAGIHLTLLVVAVKVAMAAATMAVISATAAVTLMEVVTAATEAVTDPPPTAGNHMCIAFTMSTEVSQSTIVTT
ncbi:hypothetical protein OXX79_013680, partial [Metschnikowia pulcherrima]